MNKYFFLNKYGINDNAYHENCVEKLNLSFFISHQFLFFSFLPFRETIDGWLMNCILFQITNYYFDKTKQQKTFLCSKKPSKHFRASKIERTKLFIKKTSRSSTTSFAQSFWHQKIQVDFLWIFCTHLESFSMEKFRFFGEVLTLTRVLVDLKSFQVGFAQKKIVKNILYEEKFQYFIKKRVSRFPCF